MKKSLLSILLMGLFIFCLTGCTDDKEIANLNPELSGVETFVIDDTDVLGIKKDGTKVMIMKDIAKNKKMHSIDYANGKIYLSQAETKLDYPTPNSRSKMLVVKKIWYDEIDLNQGDGNYQTRKIYEYDNEDTSNTFMPAPQVYNGKLYIVKNAEQIISVNLDNLEVTVLDDEITKKIGNTIYGTYIYLDKQNGNLYYTGPIGDKSCLAKYNLKNNEREIIESSNNVVYHYQQFTKDGVIFNVQHYDGNYETEVKKYTFSDNKITLLTNKQTDTFYACSDKYVTTKDAGSVYDYDFGPHYMNIIINDKDFKEVKKVFEKVNDEVGIILWPYTYDKVEVSDGKKNYILDCNNSELTEIGNMYTQVAIVE